MENIRNVLKNLTIKSLLFILGGLVYCLLEFTWKGKTSLEAYIVAGICFILITEIGVSYEEDETLLTRVTAGATVASFFKLMVLTTIKIYSADFVNTMMSISGISLIITGTEYILIWFVLSLLAIVFDDYIRYYLFYEDKPNYKLF